MASNAYNGGVYNGGTYNGTDATTVGRGSPPAGFSITQPVPPAGAGTPESVEQ